MAYLYRKIRPPFWYIQYVDSKKKKHDKSTGRRADDPNDTAKAKRLRAELEANEHGHIPLVNGAAWDSWVPKYLDRHCQTEATLERYEDAWKWTALWLQRCEISEIHVELKTEPEWMQIAFEISLHTGCRLRETRIPLSCVDFTENKITFPSPKGGEDKAFSIPMPSALKPLFERLKSERRSFTLDFPFQPSRRSKSLLTILIQ